MLAAIGLLPRFYYLQIFNNRELVEATNNNCCNMFCYKIGLQIPGRQILKLRLGAWHTPNTITLFAHIKQAKY